MKAIYLGEKAYKLYEALSKDNNINPKYMLTKIIIREARAEATTLTADRLRERLKLIDDVEDELALRVNVPPQRIDTEQSTNPRNLYRKIWNAHKRLSERGMGSREIHDYCMRNYGIDFNFTPTPNKRPKNIRGGRRIEVR